MAGIQFAPWSSDVELPFYVSLAAIKVDHDKLDDAARKVLGRYELRPSDPPERSARMQLHSNALTVEELPTGFFRAEGILKNVNTVEAFKALDRPKVMENAGRIMWDGILDGSIYACPSLLASFYVLFFADLKKYRFTYHFAFPAIHSDPPWRLSQGTEGNFRKLRPIESAMLFDTVQTWRYSVDQRQHGFFLAKRSHQGFSQGNVDHNEINGGQERPETPQTPKLDDLDFQWSVGSLASYDHGFFNGTDEADRFVCFVDPSNFEKNPGWMLRNLLVLVRYKWRLKSVQVICYRDTHMQRDRARSLVLKLESPDFDPSSLPEHPQMPRITGWERAANNTLSSRTVDLSHYMDPKRLADQSVDLNLKLMKWRIAPDLDLDSVREMRCLLLGSGTLGSYVSRNLLGWGVRKITFVDNGKVSFSNPVRQPLFNFEDCIDGGLQKAPAAAEALKKIYPGVDSKGHVVSIPMAGHPIINEQQVKLDYASLQMLMNEHDVIFILTDSRESRWLPTVMGKAYGKIVMSAALGFDSYVVMRHGARTEGTEGAEELGCYFCNDVVAPEDSLKDLTLDQQCTVTRPGLAAIASALVVEMVVSLMQHPLRVKAPAPTSKNAPRQPESHPLGLVPHSVRGFLASFENLLVKGPAYDCCSACSEKVINAYRKGKWDFVKRALNEKGYVEELSGLAEVQRKAMEAEADMEFDDEDDEIAGDDNDGELI